MFKVLFDSFTVKAYLFFGGLLMLIIIIGNNIEEEPIKSEPWPPETDYENRALQNRKPTNNYIGQPPWNNERKEQTENWADFLEDLENRGYTIYDPEAEDIWEEFY